MIPCQCPHFGTAQHHEVGGWPLAFCLPASMYLGFGLGGWGGGLHHIHCHFQHIPLINLMGLMTVFERNLFLRFWTTLSP